MEDSAQQPAKPGTACLGCRRRKLKCSREDEGCKNCTKADLPCVYPAPETGVKRKRGPYKKDKPARERHLEDLVKYLEPKAGGSDAVSRAGTHALDSTGASRGGPSLETSNGANGASTTFRARQSQAGASEDLVKDALIALTKSSVSDSQSFAEHSTNATGPRTHMVSTDAGLPGSHPSARRLFEYWDLFVHRVDPLLKIIHCPSFTKNLLAVIDDPSRIAPHVETLLFSIYFAAVSTCTGKEAQRRFGESRSVLLKRYGKTIEAHLSDNYSLPALESLQALVLYLVSSVICKNIR